MLRQGRCLRLCRNHQHRRGRVQNRKANEMTRDEILNMPAGRKMDALIAEKVMGWTKLGGKVQIFGGQRVDLIMLKNGKQEIVPRYSTDRGDVWEVASFMQRKFSPCQIQMDS